MHALAEEVLGNGDDSAQEPADPLLRVLLAAARSGAGDVVRLSTRRAVFRLPHEGSEWLLKVDRPRRRFERVRSWLRPPSGLREAAALRRLAAKYPAVAGLLHAEACSGGASFFARPWWPGQPVDRLLPEHAHAVMQGIAQLHDAGWCDSDLLPGDLLLDAAGTLRPVDLGAARIRQAATPARLRRRDLQLLLAGLPAATAEQTVATWQLPDGALLLDAAARVRRKRLHRQSFRCLRRTRDFLPQENGGIERTEGLPDEALPLGVARFNSRRTAAARFRELYEQELHDSGAPQVLRLLPAGVGWEVHATRPF